MQQGKKIFPHNLMSVNIPNTVNPEEPMYQLLYCTTQLPQIPPSTHTH